MKRDRKKLRTRRQNTKETSSRKNSRLSKEAPKKSSRTSKETSSRRPKEKLDSNKRASRNALKTERRKSRAEIKTKRRVTEGGYTKKSDNNTIAIIVGSVVVTVIVAIGLNFLFSSNGNVIRLRNQSVRNSNNQQNVDDTEKNNVAQGQTKSEEKSDKKTLAKRSFYDVPHNEGNVNNSKRNYQRQPFPKKVEYEEQKSNENLKKEVAGGEIKNNADADPDTDADIVLEDIDDTIEEEDSDEKKDYIVNMENKGFVAYDGIWIEKKALDYHKSITARWKKGDVLLGGVWHEEQDIGQWHVIVAKGKNYEGYLKKQKKYYHFLDINGQKRKFALDNVEYQKKIISPIASYFEQLERTRENAREHYELSLRCEENSLSYFTDKQLLRTIFYDPNHEQAREKLGYTRYKNEWLTEEQIKKHSDMVYLDGRWISKEQARTNGYVYHEGKWTKQDALAVEKIEEQRNSKGFLDKTYRGNAKQLSGNKVEITYDFSDRKYIQMMKKGLSDVNGGTIDIRDSILDVPDQMLYFPPVLRGNLHIEFEARIHPSFRKNIWIRLYNNEENLGEDGYSFVFSIPEYDDSPAVFNVIHVVDGKNDRLIQRKTKPKIAPGQWYKFIIRVSGSYLSAYINGKRALHKKHSKFRSGLLGFGALNSRVQFKKIKITGAPESRWHSKMVKSIEANMRAKALISNQAMGSSVSQQSIERTKMLMAHPNSKMLQYINAAIRQANNKQYELAIQGFNRAIALDRNFALSYLERGYVYTMISNFDKAFIDTNKAISLKPTYAEAYVTRGSLHQRNNDFSKAIKDFEKAISINSQYFRAYQSLARLHIGNNDTTKVREIIQRVSSIKPQKGEAKRLVKSLKIALNGPNWVRKYEKKTIHYHVMTDISQKYCNEMAARLELAFKEYSRLFGEKNLTAKKKSRVLIFDSRTEFNEYSYITISDTMESAAGYFSPITKELVLFDDYSKKETIDTLYHEGFHQFLDLIIDDTPIWFNEGMATYFGKSKVVKGRLRIGVVEPFYVLRLRAMLRSRYTPYKQLMKHTSKQFMAAGKANMHYNQSWAMIHFLIHGDNGKNRNLIAKYLAELKNKKSEKEAFEAVFSGVNFSKLESRLITHFVDMDDT
ncbi:tetratricopeptide repeat protein [Candidatus Uabimicrobium sp. HlEnr_7]|uniref:tetratricopeptide repeat protein n=1 Tax=Candidatus Uabimicrobium helgolandensis TaxID=3095367 RepID=UPI003555C64A